MYYYTIHQLPPILFAKNSLNMLYKDYCFVNMKYYCPVYKFKKEIEMPLDEIFREFNVNTINHEHFAGHSLSVGDVIQVNNRYYLCMSRGWEEIDFTKTTNNINENF